LAELLQSESVTATAVVAADGVVTVTETVVEVSETGGKVSFLRRRVLQPARALLMQGLSPDALARTIAVGTACSLFPFVGTTTALNLVVGLKLKLNQPIMQTLNQLLGPLELVCILLFIRIGEHLWGHAPLPVSVPVVLKAIRDNPRAALDEFAWTAVHAATAWLLVAPVLVLVLYVPLRLVFRRVFARKLAADAARAAALAGARAAAATS
jgi:uncharacterized protein (DUF2062 family)